MASRISMKLLLLQRISIARRVCLSPPLLVHASSLLGSFSSPKVVSYGNLNLLPHLELQSHRMAFLSTRVDETQVPASVDYRSLLSEDEFHKLSDVTIHDLQEKFEEYGDMIQLEGYDVDYGNQVLTLKLGSMGTYVINKQTPNRQIWLSSPVSGPSRFDWNATTSAWIYRRTKVNFLQLLEEEMQKLCAQPISLR